MIEQNYMPVMVMTGRDCVRESGDTLDSLGKKALVVCGYQSADRNGAIDDITHALDEAGMGCWIYRGVSPNPTVEQVRTIAGAAREQGCDLVIAIGGGSVIDAAKAAAILAAHDLTDDELFTRKEFDDALPIVAIPTTAGTGSEVTQYAILTNVAKETKSFVTSYAIFPQVSFLDGKYMKDLPAETTVHTAIDALSHAVEGYLAARSTAYGRVLALEAIRLLAPALKKLHTPEDLSLEDRDSLLYASMLAGIVISQSGTTAVHAAGYSLTYFKHVDHGRANGLLMPTYLEFLSKERTEEVSAILGAMGLSSLPEFRSLCFSLLSVEPLTEEEVTTFSEIAIQAGNIQNTVPRPTIDILQDMLRDAAGRGE